MTLLLFVLSLFLISSLVALIFVISVNKKSFLKLKKVLQNKYGKLHDIVVLNKASTIDEVINYIENISFDHYKKNKLAADSFEYFDSAFSSNDKNLIVQIENYENLTKELDSINIDLQKQKLELEKSNLDLEQFVSIASHDIKSPLRAIEYLVNKLLKSSLDTTQRAAFTEIQSRVYRLNNLLSGLLQFARLGSKVSLIKKIHFGTFVKSIFKDLSDSDKIKLCCLDLPEFHANIIPLRVVVQNLLTNAISYRRTDANSFIQVSFENCDDKYKFCFKDNGIGVKKDDRENIFNLFQTGGDCTNINGSGVGLASVVKALNLYGCSIKVYSNPDQTGSVFKFTWPKNI